MPARDEAFADTVAMAATERPVGTTANADPHVGLTVRCASLDVFEAATRALLIEAPSSPDSVATTVWSPRAVACAATEVIARPRARSARRRWIVRAVVLAAVGAVGVAVAMATMPTEMRRTAVGEATLSSGVAATTTAMAADDQRAPGALGPDERADLERFAVDAVLSGDSALARSRYRELVARTGDPVFKRVVAVLERSP